MTPQSPEGRLHAQRVTTTDGEDMLVLSMSPEDMLPDIPELTPTMIVEVIEGPSDVGAVEFDS